MKLEIYAKLQRNQIFEVAPGEIHFAGFQVNVAEPNKRYSQTLHVINISDKVQRMTVLPPMTRNFDVFYVKQVINKLSTNYLYLRLLISKML